MSVLSVYKGHSSQLTSYKDCVTIILARLFVLNLCQCNVKAAREKLLALAAKQKIKLNPDWKPTSLIAVINARSAPCIRISFWMKNVIFLTPSKIKE